MKFIPGKFLPFCFAVFLLIGNGGRSRAQSIRGPESVDAALARIRGRIDALQAVNQPELFRRHLRSVLALAEEGVVHFELAGAGNELQSNELLGDLHAIETGLQGEGGSAQAYLTEGKCPLILARLSKSDGTLQFLALYLPSHWDAKKPYPLHVQLHGRGPDTPLGMVGSLLSAQPASGNKRADLITVVPWLRGNGEWRNENGSEPDLWEAIEDVRSIGSIDPNRWYLSGHSWGGDDAWSIVQRTPDLWAAVGIMAGNPVGAPYELGLLSNAEHLPFYLWVGEKDKERMASFESFRSSLMAVNDPPKVVVAPGTGHNYRPEDAVAMEEWLVQHTRQMPRHFTFVVDTPQHRGAWGISIPRMYPDAYPQAEPRAKFECWIEGNVVRVRTWDAKKIEVDFGKTGLSLSGEVKLIVNGKARFSEAAPARPLALDL